MFFVITLMGSLDKKLIYKIKADEFQSYSSFLVPVLFRSCASNPFSAFLKSILHHKMSIIKTAKLPRIKRTISNIIENYHEPTVKDSIQLP